MKQIVAQLLYAQQVERLKNYKSTIHQPALFFDIFHIQQNNQ